ncbi:hypothetical protein RhiirB3_429252 [Rhizophagus irregularis]|nr:hypothetical protein RhiirB3_429252 [Rhizophagus irregularis]
MKQCWSHDPLKRPDASLLPKLFEEMIELCKMIDDSIALLTIACYSSSESTNFYTGHINELEVVAIV